MVLTRRDRTAERATGIEKYVTETILRNVRVLAVDQAVEEKGGQKVVVGKTATVELTLQQAEALELARQIGTIALALRSLVDSKSTTPEGAADEGNDSKGAVNTVRYGVSTLGASH
jgi:pilus assembly protein CpaB